jgi:hypothetical protein
VELSKIPSTVFLPRRTRYVVGVDLGQSTDPTAVAVLEHVIGVTDTGSEFDRHCGLTEHLQTKTEQINVRHLKRLPLGLSYPSVVEHVSNTLSRPPLCGNQNQRPAELVIDETGVGRAVGDIFNTSGLRPIRVSITAGHEVTAQGGRRWHVAKTRLISTLDAMLHTGTLRFAEALNESAVMREELKDFRRHVGAAGRFSYEARTGKHDDLVLAVAIALVGVPTAVNRIWSRNLRRSRKLEWILKEEKSGGAVKLQRRRS